MEPSSDISIESYDENVKKSTNKVRKRKKQLYIDLRKQMEFYLSDANLRKDRLFGHLMQTTQCINVDTFLNCNKIKKLTTSPDDIVKAIESSKLLTVSECKTKIYRIKPVEEKQPEDIDRCTIYVENLPSKADHGIVKSTFEKYGTVAYVSLPTFKSGNIKRFAFVEFENEESVKTILEEFKKIHEDSKILPEQLQSIITFNEDGQEKINDTRNDINSPKKRKHSDDLSGVKEKKRKSDLPNKSIKKKKKKDKTKKSSTESENKNENTSFEVSDNESPQKTIFSDNSTVEKTDDEVIPSEDEINQSNKDDSITKKKRKRNKGKKIKSDSSLSLPELRLMSKLEWKKLRNQYLNMQRQKMSMLKAQLRHPKYYKNGANNFGEVSETNPDQVKTDLEEKVKVKKDIRVKYESGIILKVTFTNPIESEKSFKIEAKSDPAVKFVDVVSNTEVFVRCDSQESAKKIVEENRWPVTKLLEGEDESKYWEKILRDRETKCSKQKETKKPRGRSKLLNKAEKRLAQHVKFIEED
ncbi:la-related protein 7 [Adelges cooleyi]|uniref:la-related protein 7 n=1 Tax=Adelges cooleyi TaxID=133065 RepID=UPI0021806915|nr:la-related protein 7 [Adelges cooleyi]